MWLVTNAASGSNDEERLHQLHESFEKAGIPVERIFRFPDERLPDPHELTAAGQDRVAVFTGDGTANSVITGLYGWDGAILVLPGGTKNLLSHRLHGGREVSDILYAVASGRARRCRLSVVRCHAGNSQHDGLAGVMAGPGTAWNDVREAMREADIAALASGAAYAIGQSVAAPTIRCIDPVLGRPEGYPLLMLTPQDDGFIVDAYHAETAGEFLAQGLALLHQDFREGPHDTLGRMHSLIIRNSSDEGIGLLIDGEPRDAAVEIGFALVSCEVDLLATRS